MSYAALLAWLVALPLAGAALTPLVAAGAPRRAGRWALATLVAAAALAVVAVVRLDAVGPYAHAAFAFAAPYGIELRLDHVGAWILPLTVFAALVGPYAVRYAHDRLPASRHAAFFALLLANLGGMVGFTLGADLFNLFVFMEVVALSSYALVAVGGRGAAAFAALKYLMIGAVSSLAMLLGTGLLYAQTGVLDLRLIAERLAAASAAGADPAPATVAFALLATSFLVKAALFPLHTWLPDAHAIAPGPVSAILSGLVVKIGILGMIRLYGVAYDAGVVSLAGFNLLLSVLGAIAIVMGAFFAMFQNDLKLMLAYSTVSNIGYIVLGLGLASPYAFLGAAVHVFNHALIKMTLFLAAGALIHATGKRTLQDLQGVARTMPLTSAALAIGAVSIVGLPPTAGFVCKWYIALGAFEADRGPFGVVLIFGALFIFVYFVRMVNALYFRPPIHDEVANAREAPWAMRGPILVLAFGCLALGVFARLPISFVEPGVLALLPGGGP